MWLLQLKAEEDKAKATSGLRRNLAIFASIFVAARVAAAVLNE